MPEAMSVEVSISFQVAASFSCMPYAVGVTIPMLFSNSYQKCMGVYHLRLNGLWNQISRA